MPTLPPGSPNKVNLTYTPTWLFTPYTSAANNVRLYNNGQNTVYVGQADVTVNTGLPILPGQQAGRADERHAVAVRDLHVFRGDAAGDCRRPPPPRGYDDDVHLPRSRLRTCPWGRVHDRVHGQHLQSGGAERGGVGEHHCATLRRLRRSFEHDTTNVVYAVTPTYGQISVLGGVV